MRVLLADDEVVIRRLLQTTLERWGHQPVVAADGDQAWAILQGDGAPEVALLDWMMPGLDGLEICRRARTLLPQSPYLILLTVRSERGDAVEGLEAGADDYLSKPFDTAELHARLNVGLRVVGLQRELARRIRELERALEQVDHLHGLLPICSYCRRIRSEGDLWEQIEGYLAAHSAVRFSHGVCPDCLHRMAEDQVSAIVPLSP